MLREQLKDARDALLQSQVLITLTWMLDHSDLNIQKLARAFLEGLRTHGGRRKDPPPLPPEGDSDAGSDAGGDDDLDSDEEEERRAARRRARKPPPPPAGEETALFGFVKAGCVPVLQGLTGSVNAATVDYADRLLRWLKHEARGPPLNRLLTTITTDPDPAVRLKVSVGVFYMCFDAKWVRDPFLKRQGLPALLAMLKSPGPQRKMALDFLRAVDPILQPMEEDDGDSPDPRWLVGSPLRVGTLAEPPPTDTFTVDDFNNKMSADLTLRVGPVPDEFKEMHVHKALLSAHSSIVAGMLSTQQLRFRRGGGGWRAWAAVAAAVHSPRVCAPPVLQRN